MFVPHNYDDVTHCCTGSTTSCTVDPLRISTSTGTAGVWLRLLAARALAGVVCCWLTTYSPSSRSSLPLPFAGCCLHLLSACRSVLPVFCGSLPYNKIF